MKTKIALLLSTVALATAVAAGSWATTPPPPAVEIVDEANVEAEIVASLEANVAKKLAQLQKH
jgi:hypothetical protein